VAVDGQHRLAALKLYKGDAELSSIARKTSIPILFLLLDEKCGYQTPSGMATRSIRMLAREVFTDLNKNARKVDRARSLILDDWSLEARCCRSLITNETATDSSTQLPLTLTRWQEDNHRFDQSYYLNSLVNIEQLVNIVLDLKPPKDPMDKQNALSFINSVQAAVGNNGKLTAEGRSLVEAYEGGYLEDDEPVRPFSRLPSDFLEVAVRGFEDKHRPWLIKVLTESAPYARFLKEARDLDMIEGSFGKFMAQTKRHRAEIVEVQGVEWNENTIKKPEAQPEALKKNHWFFKAIFQKALVRLARETCVDNAQDDRLGGVSNLIEFIQKIDTAGCFHLDSKIRENDNLLWVHIALNPGNQKIKVNRQVENRILATLRIWYYSFVDAKYDKNSATKLLQAFRAATNTKMWPACDESVEMLEKCFSGRLFFGDDPDRISKDAKQARIRTRLQEIIRAPGFSS
jgi:hypothetical protein